jgi:hypothetical protein
LQGATSPPIMTDVQSPALPAVPAAGSGLSPFPDPAVLPYRSVRGQKDWTIVVGRKRRAMVAIRVYTAGATLSHLEVELAGLKVKVGVLFTARPPWATVANAAADAAHAASGAKGRRPKVPPLKVPPKELVMVKPGRTTLVGGPKPQLRVAAAPGPGYFVIELNNRFNILRSKTLSDISWRVDGDTAAPCYEVGTIPAPLSVDGGSAVGGAAARVAAADGPTQELSLAEADALMALRAAVEIYPDTAAAVMPGGIPLRHDTETLLRFVRARKLQYKQALPMLRKHLAWMAALPAPDSAAVREERARHRVYQHGRTATGHRLTIISTARFLQPSATEAAYDPDVVVQMQSELLLQFAAEDAETAWASRGRAVASYRTLVDFTDNTKGRVPLKCVSPRVCAVAAAAVHRQVSCPTYRKCCEARRLDEN